MPSSGVKLWMALLHLSQRDDFEVATVDFLQALDRSRLQIALCSDVFGCLAGTLERAGVDGLQGRLLASQPTGEGLSLDPTGGGQRRVRPHVPSAIGVAAGPCVSDEQHRGHGLEILRLVIVADVCPETASPR